MKTLIWSSALLLVSIPAFSQVGQNSAQRLFDDYRALDGAITAAEVAKVRAAEDIKQLTTEYQKQISDHQRDFDQQKATIKWYEDYMKGYKEYVDLIKRTCPVQPPH